MALLAATTLGASSVERTRARIWAAERPAAADGIELRLIVQTYSRASVTTESIPNAGARPLASAQRAVTLEELRHGVAVDLLQVGPERAGKALATTEQAPILVAWVEPGSADLEFDALRARPGLHAFYGAAETSDGAARIVLRPRA